MPTNIYQTQKKYFIALIVFSLFFSITTKAQKTQFIFCNVYYKSDKYNLESEEKEKLIELIDSLQPSRIRKIEMRAHTDNSADSLYNIKLSEKRARSVVQFLTEEGIDTKLISYSYFGENKPAAGNESDKGKQKNRRVEIRLTYYYPPVEKLKIVKETILKPLPSCAQKPDTVIALQNGFMAKLNHCNLELLKNCITIEYTSTPEDIHNAHFNMRDRRGNQLISKGMIKFVPKTDTCKRALDSLKITLLIQRNQVYWNDNLPCNNFGFYVYDERTKRWNSMNKQSGEVAIDDISYTSLEITPQLMNRTINCDAAITQNSKNKLLPYVKYKIPKGYEFIARSCIICNGFTLVGYNETERKDRKNIWKVPVMLPSAIFIVRNNKTNDTFVVKVDDFDSCKKVVYKHRLTTNAYEKNNPIILNRRNKKGDEIHTWPLIYTVPIYIYARKYFIRKTDMLKFEKKSSLH